MGQTGTIWGYKAAKSGKGDVLDVEAPPPRYMISECAAQEWSHDKRYSPDCSKQAECERALVQGHCLLHLVSVRPNNADPEHLRTLVMDRPHVDIPMKDIMTVHPEKMPATPRPATALHLPVSAGRTSRVREAGAKDGQKELTGRPPRRRLWEQLRRPRTPARRGRWRPRRPTLPRRVHPSQSAPPVRVAFLAAKR